MICDYLSIYSSKEFLWQVASCTAREENYIPSIAVLEDLCRRDHTRCPFFVSRKKNGLGKMGHYILEPAPAC